MEFVADEALWHVHLCSPNWGDAPVWAPADGRSNVVAARKSSVQSVQFRGRLAAFMVVVAQLVEHQFVVLRVAGSSPVGHPNQCGVSSARAPHDAG